MEKKEIKLNHFNIYAVIAIIALIYFSVKCIQFYLELEMPKEIWETIIVKKNIFISNEKTKQLNFWKIYFSYYSYLFHLY